MKILIVDDDADLLDLLGYALRRAGFLPVTSPDVPTARRLLREERPDLLVLDVNIGMANGFDFLQEVRQESSVPVIMLTAAEHVDMRVRGLELGADDYLAKPFSYRELIARVRALQRNVQTTDFQPIAAPVTLGDLTVNAAERSAVIRGQTVRLSANEANLLHYLSLNEGTVVPTPTLVRQIWGGGARPRGDGLRVLVHRLRQKLEIDPAQPEIVRTVAQVGVMLVAPKPFA